MIPAFNARLDAGRMGLEMGLDRSGREDLTRVAGQRTGTGGDPASSVAGGRVASTVHGRSTQARTLRLAPACAYSTTTKPPWVRPTSGTGSRDTELPWENSASGSPWSRPLRDRAFAWMERTRARALRHRPVTPSDDRAQADDLAELRRVSAELRSAEGDAARDLRRHERDLQDSVRNRGRLARGEGSRASMTVNDLVKALGDRTLVEFASLDDRLWALTVRNGRFSIRRSWRRNQPFSASWRAFDSRCAVSPGDGGVRPPIWLGRCRLTSTRCSLASSMSDRDLW